MPIMPKKMTKTIESTTGYNASVWYMTKLHLDALNKRAVVEMSGYKDQSAYDSNKTPLEKRVFKIDSNMGWQFDEGTLTGKTYAQRALEWIKAQEPGFGDGVIS